MTAQQSSLRVLVVDDSAFMRKAISSMLKKHPEISVVGMARSGEEALEKVESVQPDVVTLDLQMPGMSGLETLERLMRKKPLPVVIVSALSEEGAQETLRALALGAVDFLPKHLNGSLLNISQIETQLLEKVKAAGNAAVKIKRHSVQTPIRSSRSVFDSGSRGYIPMPLPNAGSLRPGIDTASSGESCASHFLVVIGSSTGGPKALEEILPRLPETFPAGIIIAQHMPKFFTKAFADRLNHLCALEIREAVHSDVVRPGLILLAPGGQHLRLERRGQAEVGVLISPEPHSLPYRPSVDLLMQSAASLYGSHCLGIVLTGMGDDGLLGMRAIQAHHGRTLTQDEATSIVYGMPKAVFEGGCSERAVPLWRIADEMVSCVQKEPLTISHKMTQHHYAHYNKVNTSDRSVS